MFLGFLCCCTDNNKEPDTSNLPISPGLDVDQKIGKTYKRINDAIQYENLELLASIYSEQAVNYMQISDLDRAKILLDSADLYIDFIKNNDLKGVYLQARGDLYNLLLQDSLAHDSYYKAQEQYSTDNPNRVHILFNLAVWYSHRNDTTGMKEIMQKMKKINEEQNNEVNEVTISRISRLYYKSWIDLENRKDVKDENKILAYQDSIHHHAKKIIDCYEKDTSLYSKPIVAYDYLAMANILLTKKSTTPDTIRHYIQKTIELANPNDTILKIKILDIRAENNFYSNNYNRSKHFALRKIKLLDQYNKASNASYLAYYETYNLLSKIYEKQGLYAEALEYERKKATYDHLLLDRNRYKVVEELRKKYESQEQERELESTKKKVKVRNTINYLLAISCFLLTILVFIITRVNKLRKENTQKTLQLIEKEYKELESKYALRKEQINNTLLKKRETELKYIQELHDLEEISMKLSAFEEEENRRKELRRKNRCWHLKEIVSMIENNLSNSEKYDDYLEHLDTLNNSFVKELQAHALTDRQILYCLAFVIIMQPTDIAKCFDIQVKNVPKIKSKIKKEVLLLDDDKITLEAFLYELYIKNEDEVES